MPDSPRGVKSDSQKRELPTVGLSLLLFWMLGLRKRVRVDGYSMEPTLAHGSDVLVRPLSCSEENPLAPSELVPGCLLLLRHPLHSDRQIIKRLDRITENDQLFVLGDNPGESSDSRVFGAVHKKHLLGQVVARFPRTKNA